MSGKRLFVGTIFLSGILTACSQHPNVSINPLPPPARPTTITVAAAGDLFVTPLLPVREIPSLLGAVEPELKEANLAVCHMPQPLAPALADAAAAAGFDTCSTASSHTFDGDAEGVVRTLNNLDKVGIRHAGTARSAQEAATPVTLNVRGISVGHLSYTFSFNGLEPPDGKRWMANLIDPQAILAEARRVKQAGAEIVLLSLHWGTAYQNEPDDEQADLARELLADPAIDLIVGHHAHVVQPFEKIGDKWVAYGLGNLTTRFPDGSPENTQDAVIPTFTFTEQSPKVWRVTRLTVAATFMQYRPTPRVLNLTTALHSPSTTDTDRVAYTRILKRIKGYVNLRNAMRDGLRFAHSR